MFEASRMYHGSIKGVFRKFQECFKEVSGKFQGCLINVSRLFKVRGKCIHVVLKRGFKDIRKKFKRCVRED